MGSRDWIVRVTLRLMPFVDAIPCNLPGVCVFFQTIKILNEKSFLQRRACSLIKVECVFSVVARLFDKYHYWRVKALIADGLMNKHVQSFVRDMHEYSTVYSRQSERLREKWNLRDRSARVNSFDLSPESLIQSAHPPWTISNVNFTPIG